MPIQVLPLVRMELLKTQLMKSVEFFDCHLGTKLNVAA